MQIENFGRNVSFQPAAYYEPTNEQQVLEILRANPDRRFRTVGRLHSWSEAAKSDDILLNLKHLNSVQTDESEGRTCVRVGAGCQIKRLIERLDKDGLALPSQGLITEQTIAGAISTGTHGSGKECLSHFADEITVAILDHESGEPVVKTLSGGSELSAAKCSLGCAGVILSVTLSCQPQYRLEEHFEFSDNLETVWEAEDEFPLQQFFVIPYLWRFLVQHRKVTNKPRSLLSPIYQVYCFLGIDVGLHLILVLLARTLRSQELIRLFYKRLVPWTIVRNWSVVDKSQRILTMEHELFRHIEIEVFVKRSKLAELLDFVRSVVEFCDGNREAIDAKLWTMLREYKLSDAMEKMVGIYTHHYPICVRKVLPDSSLISMANGGNEPYYAVSFISYHKENERDPFHQFADCLTQTTSRLFDARPHWGKVCPLSTDAVAHLYPRLQEFREICDSLDPKGQFRNAWVNEMLFEGELVRKRLCLA